MSIDYQQAKVEVRQAEGAFEVGGANAMCAGRLTLTGRDDLLTPDDAGLDGATSPEEEASAEAAVVGVVSEEAVIDGVPSEAAVGVIGTPDAVAPDSAAPDAVVACVKVSVMAAASPQ